MEEHYADDDVILPCIALPNPCPIRVDIHEDRIRLFIGQRDWEWIRGCPDVSACGVFHDPPIPLSPDDPEDGD